MKGKKVQSAGRGQLVSKLMKAGLSRRQSVLVVNIMLERMIHALQRGRAVKFPFGRLVRVRRHFSKYWESMDDCPAGRNLYTVVHQLDEVGDRLLNPEQTSARRRQVRKTGK